MCLQTNDLKTVFWTLNIHSAWKGKFECIFFTPYVKINTRDASLKYLPLHCATYTRTIIHIQKKKAVFIQAPSVDHLKNLFQLL